MRIFKGIILFVLGFAAGISSFYYVDSFFYPYNYERSGGEQLTDESDSYGTINAVSNSETLCADTEFVVRKVNINNGDKIEEKNSIPSRYIGLNREQFVDSMDNYSNCPSLAELEEGFEGVNVISFSRKKVVLEKLYTNLPTENVFFVAVINNEVVILKSDKESIYFNTGIDARDLSEEEQKALIDMKCIYHESQLYDLLESYTS